MFHNKTGRRKFHLIYINVSVNFQSNKLFCDLKYNEWIGTANSKWMGGERGSVI